MKNVVFFICLILMLCITEIKDGFSQQDVLRTYTVKDGLVMNRIRGFYQDASGFIWIYTWDGLSRYEGYRFRNYITGKELSHSLINDVIEHPVGTIHVALNDGTIEQIKNLEVQKKNQLKGPTFNSFFRDESGNILVGSDNAGIYQLNQNDWKPLPALNNEKDIFAITQKDNHYYILGYKSLTIVNSNDLNHVRIISKFTKEYDFFTCLYKDLYGNILVGTAEGLKEIKLAKNRPVQIELTIPGFIPTEASWKNLPVNAVIQSLDSVYWIGTSSGLIRLDKFNDWVLMDIQDLLPSNNISALFLDNTQNLWIGTDLGAARLNLTNRIMRYNSKGCEFANYLFPKDDGGMLCICENQIVLDLDSHGNKINMIESGKTSVGLLPFKGFVHMITPTGIDNLDIHYSGAVVQNPYSSKFAALCDDKIFLYTVNGLEYCTAFDTCTLIKNIRYRIEAFAKYGNDKLLIGTWNNGLFLTSPDPLDKNKLIVEKDFTYLLPGKEVRSLMVDTNGDILVGTRYHGIVVLKCDNGFDSCNVKSYSMANGLNSNWITSFAKDHSDNIWVGSIAGLDKLIPDGNIYRVFSYSKVFGYYDQIQHLAVSSDKTIWCGTSLGYTRIIDALTDTIGPPKVFITEAVLGGQNQMNKDVAIATLPFNMNSAKFAFSSADYVSENQLKFTYRLSGSHDTLWSDPTTNHEIFYGNLQPGHYNFQVAAFGWNGNRGTPLNYRFIIHPPFWQQWWFVLLVILMLASLLYWLYKFRISQINRIQLVRDRIASDLHDEIGSSLSHVNILAEIGKQAVNRSEKPIEILERIGAEVQNSSEALDDIIWSVKTRRDTMEDVVARMRQYATEIFEPLGIGFKITEVLSVDQQLDMEFRRDLFLAYKEILRNIIRHAKASEVNIHITIDHRIVKLSVRDNGKGFVAGDPTLRNGVTNIKSRAKRWDGSAEWKSELGNGTTVNVVMKPG